MPIKSPWLTQESTFDHTMQTSVAPFWQQREEGWIKSFDKKTKLYWCRLTHESHQKAIVMVNGRLESAWKYQELFYELFQQGYDIYAFDHRGQGQSDRLLADKQKGYVEDFEDYLRDMDRLLAHFDLARYERRFLLAHSMGGAIATRYLQTRPQHPFDAMAACAPMFGINIPWYCAPFAVPMSILLTTLYPQPHYAPGYQDYQPIPFEENRLTHSQIRYRWFRALYQQQPQLQLGGPTTRWVWQSLLASKQCIQLTRQVKIPFLLLQAGKDAVVSNAAQQRFIRKLRRTNPHCELQVIDGAHHELLFESDPFRDQTLAHLCRFLAQQ